MLIAKGQGVLPSTNVDNHPWPIYVDQQPATASNVPEQIIVIYNTQGQQFGRIHNSGVVPKHPGFQLLIRSVGSQAGYNKGTELETVLNTDVFRELVVITPANFEEGVSEYLVQSAQQRSDILPLGEDRDNQNLYLHTLNYTTVISPVNSGTGT
jgi:hypothetical protein